MGRPIEKRYFGNLSSQSQSNESGVGGEGVLSVAVATGTAAGKTPGTYAVPASAITAPQIPGGIKPTLSLVVLTATTASITVTDPGSGYTSAPTITLAATLGGGTGSFTATATLTTTRQNAIAPQAFIPVANGGTAASLGDIVKQTGARSFLVRTSDGVGKCVLTTGTVTAGLMSITATKADTTTFLVRKITGRKVWDASGNSYAWTLGSATGSIVSLTNN